MTIPSQKDIQLPLLEEIEAAGGQAKPSELYDRVARHFPQLTQADQEARYSRTGQLIWPNRVQFARNDLVKRGEVDASTRGLWRITDRERTRLGMRRQDKIMPEAVKTALQATTIAQSFLGGHLHVFFTRPKKAVREDGFWLVEIDIGPIIRKISKFKIDANSGEILEYDLP